MLIGASDLIANIEGYRMVWFSGRTGGHKTSLAYYLAKPYLEKGWKLITNNKNMWGDDLEKCTLDENGMLNAIVILDEAGLYFKTEAQIQTIASYLAKMNLIVMMPSRWPVARSAQVITIQPLYNLKATGLPVVVYRWSIKMSSFTDKGHFLWVYPNEIYGIYSRQDPGRDPEEIVDFLAEKTSNFREFHGHSGKQVSSMGITKEDLLLEASIAIQEASESLKAVSRRKGRRR